ncbi:MAG: hypothetical protein LC803_09335 [Acidobacteria bacterium]|nr:hypothetical protein [Acidobacteriota bacterium]
MAYDTTSLIQEVKTRAKDSTLTDSLITTWLQETQDGVLGHYRLSFLETSTTATLSINDLTRAYPTDLQVVLGLKLDDGAQVSEPSFLSYQEFTKLYPAPEYATASWPQAVTDYGRALYWSCPFDRAYILNLRYIRKPVQLTSGAVVPDVPVEYRELMIRGALQRVEEYRENFDIAAFHSRKVEDLAEDLLQRYGARQLMTPHRATLNGRRVGRITDGRESIW